MCLLEIIAESHSTVAASHENCVLYLASLGEGCSK